MSFDFFIKSTMFILFAEFAKAQYVVDWGKYLVDYDSLASWDFTNFDESEKMAVDIKSIGAHEEYIYVIGKTGARSDSGEVCLEDKMFYGDNDAFLAKYDKCGNLVWRQLLGTDANNDTKVCGDYALCLALDRDTTAALTNIYIAGYSYTGCYPCSYCEGLNSNKASAYCERDTCIFQQKKKDNMDAFIAKYDENGHLLKWTYFGGYGVDYILGMDIYNHDVFITGTSNSLRLVPATTPAFDSTLSPGGLYGMDAFIGQFDATLCNLKFFSYIGGDGDDRGHDIKVYNNPNHPQEIEICVSGTVSATLKDSSYAQINNYKGGISDGFLSLWKNDVTTNGFKPAWFEYIGGQKADRIREILVDKDNGDITLSGFTRSSDLISSINWLFSSNYSYDATYNGEDDVFLSKFDLSGKPLWCTYFGGDGNDYVRGLKGYKDVQTNYAVFVGATDSKNFPIQSLNPPFQSSLNGGANQFMQDAFVAIITAPEVSFEKQKLEFASYFGGSKNEWDDVWFHYGPDLAIGGNNEIYMTFYTKSSDIQNFNTSMSYHYNKNTGANTEVFLAKLLNANNPSQFDCTGSDYNWGADVPEKQESSANRVAHFLVYPNPTISGNVSVEYFSDTVTNIQILIYNIIGEIVFNKTESADAMKNTYRLQLCNISPGIYLIELRDKHNINTAKLIIGG